MNQIATDLHLLLVIREPVTGYVQVQVVVRLVVVGNVDGPFSPGLC